MREFVHHIARRAGQNVLAVGRRVDHSPGNDVNRGGGAFGELAALDHDGFECAGIDGELLEQHIREQRGGLDVAPSPAGVGRGHGGNALLEQRRRGGFQRGRIGEDRRLEPVRPCVISAEFGAPRHLNIEILIPAAVAPDELAAQLAPIPACASGGAMRMPARLRASRSRCSRSLNGRPPYTGTTS